MTTRRGCTTTCGSLEKANAGRVVRATRSSPVAVRVLLSRATDGLHPQIGGRACIRGMHIPVSVIVGRSSTEPPSRRSAPAIRPGARGHPTSAEIPRMARPGAGPFRIGPGTALAILRRWASTFGGSSGSASKADAIHLCEEGFHQLPNGEILTDLMAQLLVVPTFRIGARSKPFRRAGSRGGPGSAPRPN